MRRHPASGWPRCAVERTVHFGLDDGRGQRLLDAQPLRDLALCCSRAPSQRTRPPLSVPHRMPCPEGCILLCDQPRHQHRRMNQHTRRSLLLHHRRMHSNTQRPRVARHSTAARTYCTHRIHHQDERLTRGSLRTSSSRMMARSGGGMPITAVGGGLQPMQLFQYDGRASPSPARAATSSAESPWQDALGQPAPQVNR